MHIGFTEITQFWDLIKKSRSILITGPKNANQDTLATALACFSVIKNFTEDVDMVFEQYSNNQLNFLNGHEKIKNELRSMKKLVFTLQTEKAGLKNFYYDRQDEKIILYFEPKEGFYSPEDVKITSSQYQYDLIISINAPDMNTLGNAFYKNTDFFYQVPIINIGCTPNNSNFGQLNIIDITATTVSEIMYEIIHQAHQEWIDAPLANILLTGLISGTRSFRSSDVTPQTLQTASALIQQGADRDMIIQNLYRSKSIQQLKLWGRALSKLQQDQKYGILWTSISQEDLRICNASDRDIDNVVEELLSSSQHAHTILLGIEHSQEKEIKVFTSRLVNGITLLRKFQPIGSNHELSIYTKEDLSQTLHEVIEELRAKLPALDAK